MKAPLGADDRPPLATEVMVGGVLSQGSVRGPAHSFHSTFQMAILPSSRPAPLST